MALTPRNELDPTTNATMYLYNCITKNKYFFTFEGRACPEEDLGAELIQQPCTGLET